MMVCVFKVCGRENFVFYLNLKGFKRLKKVLLSPRHLQTPTPTKPSRLGVKRSRQPVTSASWPGKDTRLTRTEPLVTMWDPTAEAPGADNAADTAYIKGQLQGLRAALRGGAAGACADAPPPLPRRPDSHRSSSPGRAVPALRSVSPAPPLRSGSPGRGGSPGPMRGGGSPGGAGGASPSGRRAEDPSAKGGAVGQKSDCVLRVEEMKRQREERRRRAEEAKVRWVAS